MKKQLLVLGIALVAFGACDMASIANPPEPSAAVLVSSAGVGFVGKGDVQLKFGWNDKALQTNATSVQFRMNSVTEVTWTCTNDNNDQEQERARTTTTQGLVTSIARDYRANKITGFNLSGFSGGSTTSTEGPSVNSCPGGPWSLTTPAGDPVPVSGGGLEVSGDSGTSWMPLP